MRCGCRSQSGGGGLIGIGALECTQRYSCAKYSRPRTLVKYRVLVHNIGPVGHHATQGKQVICLHITQHGYSTGKFCVTLFGRMVVNRHSIIKMSHKKVIPHGKLPLKSSVQRCFQIQRIQRIQYYNRGASDDISLPKNFRSARRQLFARNTF